MKTLDLLVRLYSTGAVLACAALCVPTHAAGVASVGSSDRESRMEGFNAPEDLVKVGDGLSVIASRLGGGGLNVIDAKTRVVTTMDLDGMPRVANADYPCAALSGSDSFVSHGLSIKPHMTGHDRLYVVRHGGREAIEIFDFETNGDYRSLRWIGCVLLPKGFAGNAVVGQRDGGFFVTSMFDAGDIAFASKLPQLYAAHASGAVLQWSPRNGFKQMRTGPISGPNGIELSSDERWLFVAGWASQGIWAFDLRHIRSSPRQLRVDFMPDNLRWAENGSLLAAGMRANPQRTFDCAMTAKPNVRCTTRWTVLSIDTGRMRAQYEIRRNDRSGFGDVSVALQVGQEIWLGSFSGNSIAVESDTRARAAPGVVISP